MNHPKIKAYLAHNFAAQSLLKAVREQLKFENNIEVTSSWIDLSENEFAKTNEERTKHAEQDLADISIADILIIFCKQHGPTPGRGKYVEVGYALGSDIPVIAIGYPEDHETSVFFFANGVIRFSGLQEFLDSDWLKTRRQVMQI